MGLLRGHERFGEHRDDFDAAEAAAGAAKTPGERDAAMERCRLALAAMEQQRADNGRGGR